MITGQEINSLINEINQLHSDGLLDQKESDYWEGCASKMLIFVDDLILKSETVNSYIPKSIAKTNTSFSLIETFFTVLDNVTNPNIQFTNRLWTKHLEDSISAGHEYGESMGQLSLYELMYSRLCALFTQMLGDRFPYVQKVLIKNIFSTGKPVRSVMASDLYMFLIRLFNKQQRTMMCQLIMNLCKIAPPNALVNGVSLINRIKHPFINFESPLYQSELTRFSSDGY